MKNVSDLETESIAVKTKKPLRTLYKEVKLPVMRTLFGSLLYLCGTLVIAAQADAVAAISVGNFKDLSPVFTYALMCAIGYVLSFASVVADLGFVELAARIRKKIWKKIMRLPLSTYDRESPNRVLSRAAARFHADRLSPVGAGGRRSHFGAGSDPDHRFHRHHRDHDVFSPFQ